MSDLSKLDNKQLAIALQNGATILAQRIMQIKEEYDDPVIQKPVELVTLNDYQKSMLLTAGTQLSWRDQLLNAALGLAESGEVQNNVKKHLFHNWSPMFHSALSSERDLVEKYKMLVNQEFRVKTADELGDNLFYIAWMADLLGYTLADIAVMNRTKLIDRHGGKNPSMR